jgi:hypothetical protein
VWKKKSNEREKRKGHIFKNPKFFKLKKGKEKKNKTLQNRQESFCSQKRKDTHLKHAHALLRKGDDDEGRV